MTGAMSGTTRRIAMWSGPRNISTAMMYSFASRRDCAVWDEPFYAFYLSNVGITHPFHDEIVAAGETDWDKVVERCTQAYPDQQVFYQKHMTHHMLSGYDRRWLLGLDNAFLIRAPERVLTSYAKKRAEVTLNDIGFLEQVELFDMICDALGKPPPVVDADDVLAMPATTLPSLCAALGIDFCDRMLSWQQGPKPYDGVWAKHWYNAVWQSDGFRDPPSQTVQLDAPHQRIADQARPIYEKLKAYKL